MRHRYVKGFIGVVAALAVTVAVSACGSSSSGSQGSTPTNSTTGTATTTAAPIKIGMICTCSGPLSTGTDTADIYKAWVASTNAAGGINGHPIQLTVVDDSGNPATSQTAVKSLVGKHVIAVVDATNDDETWASYIQKQNIPVVGMGTSTAPFYSNPDFYPEGQTEDRLFDAIVGAAQKGGGTKLGLLYCAEAVQCQEGIAPLKATAKSLGMPLVYTGSVSATAPNYTAQCVAAQQAGVTALFVADIANVIKRVGADCNTQGYHPLIVVDGESMYPELASAPGIKDNTIFEVPNLPYFAKSAAITEMNNAINKYDSGELTKSSYGEIPAESWMAGKLFQAAAAAGKLGANGSTPTSAQLIAGLNSLKGETLGGLAPPLTFVAGKPHPVDCWYWATLKNGTYSTPYGVTPQCAKS